MGTGGRQESPGAFRSSFGLTYGAPPHQRGHQNWIVCCFPTPAARRARGLHEGCEFETLAKNTSTKKGEGVKMMWVDVGNAPHRTLHTQRTFSHAKNPLPTMPSHAACRDTGAFVTVCKSSFSDDRDGDDDSIARTLAGAVAVAA